MATNNSNPENEVVRSRAERRAEAFVGPRFVNSQVTDARDKSTKRDLDSVADASPLTASQHRLQQLALFREMKQLAPVDTFVPVTKKSSRGSRDATVVGQLNWVPLGPLGVEKGQAGTMPLVSGRVKSVAVAPGGQRVYAATANGGVWSSTDAGKTWRSLFDEHDLYMRDPALPADPTIPVVTGKTDTLSCGAIAIVPGSGASTDKIYVGTGEGNDSLDSYFGVGPMVSSDGGSTWVREEGTPSLVGQGCYAIVVDPDDPECAVVATSIGVFKRVPDGPGKYKWDQKGLLLAGNKVTGLTVAKGAAGKRYYASVMGDKVYTSNDGEVWTAAGASFPTNRIGRMSIAAHPTTPEVAYAQVAFAAYDATVDGPITDANPQSHHLHGVYRLDTRLDNNWRKINDAGLNNLFGPDRTSDAGQGWYDNWIVVSPNNENRIYVAGSIAQYKGEWSAAIFRTDVQVATAAGVTTVTGASGYIGGAVHGDVHSLVFTPNEPEQLWVGCDGGVFMTRQASGTGDIFLSLNAGLQTFTMNNFGMHPDEEESFFCSVQDNGCLRYVGEDFWLHSFGGDSGACIINWKRRNEVLATWTANFVSFSNQYGARGAGVGYLNTPRNVPIQANREPVNFYAPMVGMPFKPGLPDAQADMVAFGTNRLWISTNFAANWFPLPSRAPGDLAKYNSDRVLLNVGVQAGDPARVIHSIAFADSKNILVGLSNGQVFKYTDTSASNNWTTVSNPPVHLSALPNPGGMPRTAVTDLVVHPTNANQFYAVFGGSVGSHQHVWFCDGTNWVDRSGSLTEVLIDVHFNTLVINPDNPSQIFAGCDVGVFKSENGGSNWTPFSRGLPETVVVDLQINTRALAGGGKLTLLRVATHGRGVFECDISPGVTITPPAQLYLRDNIMDRGRFPTRKGVTDPRSAPSLIPDLATPDIKVDVPDATGKYQFAPNEKLSPGQFTLTLVDKSNQIPVSAAGKTVSRVYVQVHSLGMLPAYNVQVTLMIKEMGGATLPDLPANYDQDIRGGIPINRDGWQTVGIQMAQGVVAGFPKVVCFELPSTFLPAHGTLGGGKNLVLAALLHYPQLDEYSSTTQVLNPATANNVSASERKITAKQVKAVQSASIPSLTVRQPLTGYLSVPPSATAPEAPYDAFLAQAFRINDGLINRLLLSRLALPISNRGTDGIVTNPDARRLVFADTITLNADISLTAGIPLIWFARKKITIGKTITAKALGAPRTGDGDFGGAGGGGANTAGKKCTLPNTTVTMGAGGAKGNNPGALLDPAWASRALLQMHFCKGGGAGGEDVGGTPGGLGGGVVILCAPVIEFTATGKIDASGADGPGSAGGGGGGLVVFIAGETINLNDAGPNQNVLVAGGRSSGTGGPGGAGFLLRKLFS